MVRRQPRRGLAPRPEGVALRGERGGLSPDSQRGLGQSPKQGREAGPAKQDAHA